jgi:hypothetical protein
MSKAARCFEAVGQVRSLFPFSDGLAPRETTSWKVEIESLFHVEDFGLMVLVAETKRGRLIVNVRRSRVQASLSEA